MSQERIERILGELREFVREREWEQFHSPENLAKSISIEAGELLECFQWGQLEDTAAVSHELADVLTYCLLLADRLGLDPHAVVLEKLEITRAKYPVGLSRGRSIKHDQL
ncbi:nucleotide pyrophosphohydrolase [Sinomonas atrocyanea]|uniref:nucleotide pyrophosphohydrolase n=1 Tax=Sinomonas atrocyanea TaxID=37927 RepID=UPI003D99A847